MISVRTTKLADQSVNIKSSPPHTSFRAIRPILGSAVSFTVCRSEVKWFGASVIP